MIRQVCSRIGVRGLVGAGWSRFAGESDDQVFVAGDFNHDAVLPRCLAAVHHGGAGTTATSLRAGAPTIVCSVFVDQPLWAWRMKALGVGEGFPFQALSADKLIAALQRALQPEVRAQVRAVAARLEEEHGAVQSTEALLRLAGRAADPGRIRAAA